MTGRWRPALGLAAALWTVGCGHADQEESRTEAAVPVETAVAHSGAIRATTRATGIVGAASGALQAVTAPSGARIVSMPKATGDVVRKGDLLVRFDAPALTADAAAKDAARAQAEARLDNARQADERSAGLLERGIAARKEVEDAHRELRDAEAALQQAKAEQAATRTLAERAVVRAAFGGIVVERTHNPGDLVEGGGAPILQLVDPSRLQVDASVSPADVGHIKPGDPARIRRSAADDAAVTGRVAGAPAAINIATGMAAVRIALPADARLPIGLSVQVDIEGEERSGVTLLPATALGREGPATFVYVVGPDRKAHRQEVVTGVVGDSEVEIRSGVHAGDVVVVRSEQALPDGAQVAIAP